MRNLLIVLFTVVIFTVPARADEQTRNVQEALKDQGFYYGPVDGQTGTETTAAIRRYQIRNGLEVSGQLSAETMQSLKITGNATPPAITSVPKSNPAQDDAPKGLRAPSGPPERSVVESDRNFLRRSPAPGAVPPPPNVSSPVTGDNEESSGSRFGGAEAGTYQTLFVQTPYGKAPLEVQRRTFLRAQAYLARSDFYRGPIDGLPGPGVERAIRDFQVDADLRPSGRLDMDTLAEMRLLPGPSGPFPTERGRRQTPDRRVFRGIWIH